ncbi:hypothetical protein HWV62_39990 [Athelia sp. TMB]|nr:hypothetical protein HWV62_39990 [Athelia sp. TMB]
MLALFTAEISTTHPQLYASEWRRAQTDAYVESYYRTAFSQARHNQQSDDASSTTQTASVGREKSPEAGQVDELADNGSDGDDDGDDDEPLLPASGGHSSLPTPPATPPPSATAVLRFLRSCQPNLEHLLPFFTRIGIRTRSELAGVMRWPTSRRDAWLRDLRREEEWAEFELTRVQIEALMVAFVYSQEVVNIFSGTRE